MVVGWLVGWTGSWGGNEMKCGITIIIERKHLRVVETGKCCTERCSDEDWLYGRTIE